MQNDRSRLEFWETHQSWKLIFFPLWIKLIFLTPLADICSCFDHKLASFFYICLIKQESQFIMIFSEDKNILWDRHTWQSCSELMGETHLSVIIFIIIIIAPEKLKCVWTEADQEEWLCFQCEHERLLSRNDKCQKHTGKIIISSNHFCNLWCFSITEILFLLILLISFYFSIFYFILVKVSVIF